VAIGASDREGRAGGLDRRAVLATALVGPLVAAAIFAGASRVVDEQRRSAAAARDLTTLFAASYGVLSGTEAAQRTLSAALAARDSGLRFIPPYESAERALDRDRATVARLSGLVPELAATARELDRPLDDAAVAARRVVEALRGRDRERAVTAGYEFTASITLARDAAQSLVDAAAVAIPRKLGAAVGRTERPASPAGPLWSGGFGGLAVVLMMWGVLARPVVRLSRSP
jgi:hypothetical protein